jgi:hypothetical protein
VTLNSKVLVLPNICGIEIDLSAAIQPSLQPSLQPFYNTFVQNSTAQPAYISPSKARFSESGEQTRAGMVFTQTLSFQFPSNDPLRASRIKDYLKVKYVYVKLSTGMVFFFGRNDVNQNSEPKVKSSSNEKTTQVTYTCKSISSIGFTNGSWDFNFPEDFPINFYNL